MIGLPVDTPLRPQESIEVVPVQAGAADLVARGPKDRPELVEHQARVEVAGDSPRPSDRQQPNR